MSILLLEGFDGYASRDQLTRDAGFHINDVQNGIYAENVGKWGGGGYFTHSDSSTTANIAFRTSDTKSILYAGGWFYLPNVDPATTGVLMAFGLPATTNFGTDTMNVRLSTTRQLLVYSNTTLVYSTGYFLNQGGWYFLEFGVFINSTTGWWEVRVNGSTVASDSNVNTGTTLSRGVTFLNRNNTPNSGITYDSFSGNRIRLDDVYVLDDSGDAPYNTFLGPIRIMSVAPTANGAITSWTPSGSGSNYQQLVEKTADGDTSYVGTSTTDSDDLYTNEQIPNNPSTIYAVKPRVWAGGAQQSLREIYAITRTAGTTYELGPYNREMRQGYRMVQWDSEVNPNTGLSWTASEVNNAQFGIRLKV